jgi:hypothetical protein
MMRRFALSCLFALTLPLAAHAEQLVVVEARGIAMAQGATVDSDKPLSLKEGQHLTLISPAGVTVQLDGAFSGKPSAHGSGGVSLSTKLAALGAGQQRFSEVGTTRGTTTTKLPSPWLLDISRSGAVCLRDGSAAVLWQPAPSKASDIVITPDDRSWRVTVAWPAGANTLAVDQSEAPLHAGATYYVTVSGERHAISIYDVPASLTTRDMRAAWLAQKGCEAQAEALASSAQ